MATHHKGEEEWAPDVPKTVAEKSQPGDDIEKKDVPFPGEENF